MKMTRLEAIKAWGRASREGKPIPDDVKAVLLATQNEREHTPFVVLAVPPSINSPYPPSVKVSKKKKVTKMDSMSGAGRNGALTAEQMEVYNQKRKLDNQKRQNHSQLIQDLRASGLTKKQAVKKARSILSRNFSDKINDSKHIPAARITRIVKPNNIYVEEKSKSDPWLLAKVKQAVINQSKIDQRRIDTALLRRPISCIECKIDFTSFGAFVDHTRDVHHTSVSTPKLIINTETPNDAAVNVDVSPESQSKDAVEPTSIPVVKTPETFSDKWIRLFSENGYTVAMVDAFRREATKQGMDVKQIHDFLSVCKPSKHLTVASVLPFKETATVVNTANAVETIVDTPKASVTNDPSYATPLTDSIEQAVFADRIVRTRVNQYDFKERVAANFGYRCAITGSGEALEAAHIEPVGTGNNNTSNGVLMLACLHRLFDAGMMAINPDTLTVHFRDDCTYFAKSMLEGTELNEHTVRLNKSGLLERWYRFNA
ncbi:HNH endonuclease [Cronobacter sakazakii]|uniref:HNH endonuclease signature motif containing protein n=1 Tax=Cronobacter sakazakii TaxID=28141 RepID=UPI000BEA21FD|nr:HNH endonuclease signature motif containing protein [Cronobacter sakazakii]EKC6209601.1 HNH endonuclease [Cronobacter sakazakii]EKD3161547.1 HNH endonuclease [Cronobacter sakazakii]EKD3181326.1 HNH endonuclease [Cronobacter sakazakii]EKD3191670.1 HNH endonuclease [Cronobacter sakazakii]EKD3200532.1 HNH endonuclease [Cronobacter sakazakii]